MAQHREELRRAVEDQRQAAEQIVAERSRGQELSDGLAAARAERSLAEEQVRALTARVEALEMEQRVAAAEAAHAAEARAKMQEELARTQADGLRLQDKLHLSGHSAEDKSASMYRAHSLRSPTVQRLLEERPPSSPLLEGTPRSPHWARSPPSTPLRLGAYSPTRHQHPRWPVSPGTPDTVKSMESFA
eukprot:7390861-Prymnesium_polylepis.1